ncbi:MAG: MFS family permease [Chlamydiales bacterium]|jgi:MFS family permease
MSAEALDPRRLRINVKCIRAMNFTWMFMLIMPVIVPFFGSVGLTPGQVFQVQAIFGMAIVLLEVPTGYLSDVIGRKRCLVLAGALHGLAFTVLASVQGFGGVVVFELLAALAVCLYSGTDVALMYESLEELGEHSQGRRALGQRLFWMQVGETSAALVGGWIAVISLRQVAVWNAIVGWLPFFVALFLVDIPRPRLDRHGHLQNLGYIWRELFVRSALVRWVLLNLIAYGLSTLLAVWVFQGYWAHMQVDLSFFGYLWASYNLTVALAGRVAHRFEVAVGVRATIACIATLPVVGFLGLAWTAGDPGVESAVGLGLALGILFQLGRGLTQVVLKDELNARVPADLRATANSMSSLGVRLGYALVGPLLGVLIDGPGYPVALGSCAALFVLVGLFLALPLARRLGPDVGT